MIKVSSCHIYKLEYPKGTRIYDIVYTSLLKLFKNWDNNEIEVDNEKDDLFFKVENIINSK